VSRDDGVLYRTVDRSDTSIAMHENENENENEERVLIDFLAR